MLSAEGALGCQQSLKYCSAVPLSFLPRTLHLYQPALLIPLLLYHLLLLANISLPLQKNTSSPLDLSASTFKVQPLIASDLSHS